MSDCPHCDPLNELARQWNVRASDLQFELPRLHAQGQAEIDDQAFRASQAQQRVLAAQLHRAHLFADLAALEAQLTAFGGSLGTSDLSIAPRPGWYEYTIGNRRVWSRLELTPDALQRLIDAIVVLEGLAQAIATVSDAIVGADAQIHALEQAANAAETALQQTVAFWEQRLQRQVADIEVAKDNGDRYYEEWKRCLADCKKPIPPPIEALPTVGKELGKFAQRGRREMETVRSVPMAELDMPPPRDFVVASVETSVAETDVEPTEPPPTPAATGPTVTIETGGNGDDSVAADAPFTVTVEVPRSDPSVDPPETIEIEFKTASGDDETLELRWTGNATGPARYRSNPVTIERGATGGGRVTLFGFEFSTGGMDGLDTDNGEEVTIAFGNSTRTFKVYTTWVQQGIGRSREVISKHKQFWTTLLDELSTLPSSPEVERLRTNAKNHLRLVTSAERIDSNTQLLDTQRLAYVSAYANLLETDLGDWDPRDEMDLVSRARDEADRLSRGSLWRGLARASLGLYRTVTSATPAASAWTLFTGRDVMNQSVTWDQRVLAALELAGWVTLYSGLRTQLGGPATVRPSRTQTPGPCRECFSGDTEIVLADGRTAPICDVTIGASVRSVSRSGQIVDGTVTRVFVHYATEIVALELVADGRRACVAVTAGHVVVGERGPLAARDLRIGQRLLRSNGTFADVESIEPMSREGIVYNLEVHPTNRYCVGPLDLVVHNWCETKSTSDLNRVLDRPSNTYERYRHPTTGRPILEPGFRDRRPMDMGNRTAAAARNLRDATFPDAFATGPWIDGSMTAIAFEMKTVQRIDTVIGHFRQAKVQLHCVSQRAGRALHLPLDTRNVLVVDLRLCGQRPSQALRDLSIALRERFFAPDFRGAWDGVAFLVGSKGRSRLAVNPAPLGAGANPHIFQIP